MVKICVIGAGVIGLSTALRVLEQLPSADVTVIADRFSPNTTSDVSGGFWEPHLLGDTPNDKIRQWSGKTLDHMMWLANTDCAKYTGACIVSGYRLNEDPNAELPFWTDMVMNFRPVTPRELKQFPDMHSGFFYTTVMLEPRLYLQWLMKRLQRRGGRLKSQRVENLQQLAGEFDVIVNCSGVGAHSLVNDTSVQPARGQVLRAQAPWIKHFLICIGRKDLAYVLPSANYVVLGGTQYQGDWNTDVSYKDKKKIWDNCKRYLPSLSEAVIESDGVGLRPTRPTVRVEIEHVNLNGKITPVVHNYGHGGGGVTLHWGCAEEVAQMVSQVLHSNKPTAAKL